MIVVNQKIIKIEIMFLEEKGEPIDLVYDERGALINLLFHNKKYVCSPNLTVIFSSREC